MNEKPSLALRLRGILTAMALKLPGAPKLSNFEMIEPPASAEELHGAIVSALQGLVESGRAPMSGTMVLPGDLIAPLASRMAVAEVDLSQGFWPLRSTKRVRIVRPSHSRYWAYQDSGEWTPGSQAEELERRWSITQDARRQSLSRSLEHQFSGSRLQGREGGND